MESRVWVHALDRATEDEARGIAEHLRTNGFEVQPWEPCLARSPGVVVFMAPSPRLSSFVAEVAEGGEQRVLGVGLEASITPQAVWPLMRVGLGDYIVAHGRADACSRVGQRLRRWMDVDRVADSPIVRDNLVGSSARWRETIRQLVDVGRHSRDNVLVLGESGTGKELAARLIHSLDREGSTRKLVLVDCTTITPSLSGSELFGHEKGAFTGAAGPREGAFALADGGTLFLDEVGELPLAMQAELLRVIQEGAFKPVGSDRWRKTSFRLVCATNRDLVAEVAAGRFRQDLFYRIAAHMIRMPALSERRADVLPLARHFLRTAGVCRDFDPLVESYLQARAFPGNVRELRQLVMRMRGRHIGDGPLTLGDIPPEDWPEATDPAPLADIGWIQRALTQGMGLEEIGRRAKELAIACALEEHGGSLREAAERLGVTTRALQQRRKQKVEELGGFIDVDEAG